MGIFDIFKNNKSNKQSSQAVSIKNLSQKRTNATINMSMQRPPTQAEANDDVIPVEIRIKSA